MYIKFFEILISEINVDAVCVNGGPSDQCKDVMSTCSEVTGGAYKCTCNSGYYNLGGTCSNSMYFHYFYGTSIHVSLGCSFFWNIYGLYCQFIKFNRQK